MVAGRSSQATAILATSVGIGFGPGVCQQVGMIADDLNLRASLKATLLEMEMGIAILSSLQEAWPIVRVSLIVMVKSTLGLKEPRHI